MHRTKASLLIGALFILSSFGFAQEPPDTTPTPTPNPVGHIRVWDFAYSISKPIEVSLIGGASPLILSRSMIAGRIGSYQELPVGSYKVSVRDDSSPEKDQRRPELIPSATINLVDKSFQTVVLMDDRGSPKIFVVNDGVTKESRMPPGAKRLRAFNFAKEERPALKTVQGNRLLWDRVPAGMSEQFFPADTSTVDLIMVSKLPSGRESQQVINADFTGSPTLSVVIFFDRYGRLTFQGFEDNRGCNVRSLPLRLAGEPARGRFVSLARAAPGPRSQSSLLTQPGTYSSQSWRHLREPPGEPPGSSRPGVSPHY